MMMVRPLAQSLSNIRFPSAIWAWEMVGSKRCTVARTCNLGLPKPADSHPMCSFCFLVLVHTGCLTTLLPLFIISLSLLTVSHRSFFLNLNLRMFPLPSL